MTSLIHSMLQQCIPSAYLSSHMDTIPKLISHVLIAMAVCNLFLFVSCFQAAMAPNLGLDTLLISFLLCFQNVVSWIILNNRTLPHSFHVLAPSEFMLGVTLGIAIGGSILSFVLSLFFGRLSKCVPIEGNAPPTIATTAMYYPEICTHKGNMMSIWFWSGIVFWLNSAIALLIALGRDELTYFAQSNYEAIGISMDEFESSFARYNSQVRRHDNNDFVQVGDAITPEPPLPRTTSEP